MSTGKILLGVLAGMAAGAAAGILLAPDKGSETRKKISKRSDKFLSDIRGSFGELIDGVNDKLETVLVEANRQPEEYKAKVDPSNNHFGERAKDLKK